MASGGSATVLLVEDNPEVASVSANLLDQLGYTVRRASDAESALCEIKRDGIDLVLSDIIMPGMEWAETRASPEGNPAASADPADDRL